MRKLFIQATLFFLLGALVLLVPLGAHAASQTTSTSPKLSASLSRNKRSVSVAFLNLTNVKSITYNLTYDSDKGPQGAGGRIKVKANTKKLSRTLLLGTCSHNVCTYHRNVKNLKLTADFTLKSGGVVSYEKNLK